MGNMTDRRTLPRVPFRARVDVLHGGELFPSTTLDISESGLRLGQTRAMVNSRLKVLVDLPEGINLPKKIVLDGIVVWKKLGSIGVELAETSQRIANQVMQQIAPMTEPGPG